MRAVAFFVFALAVLGSPGFADVANSTAKSPECFCTDQTGQRVELGVSICLIVDGRSFTARCEMSLNNPMWREMSQGCLSSSLLPYLERFQRLDPTFDPGPV